ncbi:HTH-type transcriptional regulator DmlR [Pigmentiphaga humi]|uniref:HTH-type transcriptional regulator DmlR n=1 Tax=Pigmentiphaga humi TaxID=2478468 RepID=A0A3P4AZS8_9BURK|nr:LysR family transcriptional regulator [Pigmentiphaga humi]VCU68908.1 HTH-type transcriptional regulator DmlR [Pigmentiphaga humi]
MNDLGGRSGELLVFVSIVEAGGVSAGARALGLVPSTASRMLKRFEERVGARLIVREGRVFRLTREGQSCYSGARRILVAAPAYLKRPGAPKHPSELEAHSCLRLRTSDRNAPWLFLDGHAPLEISPHGSIVVDNGEALVQLAIAGFGIAQVGRFHVADQLASGALVSVLDDYRSSESEIIQAVFAGRPSVPGRVRAFIDFFTENIGARRR